MKTLLSTITILILFSCHNKTVNNLNFYPANSKIVGTTLVDSLGSVAISVPTHYDTFFIWRNESDCGDPCDKIEYRFQPKMLPIFKESGFFYFPLKDSINQFTIIHSADIHLYDNEDSTAIIRGLLTTKGKILSDSRYKIQSDTTERINGRYFSIITIDMYDSTKEQYLKKVIGTTSIKSNLIEFEYELLTKQKDSITDNFVKNSIDLLKTIQLSKGA